MAISMVIVPVMIRLAPHVGMVDLPDPRKVHTTPIPRVGGIGIVLGAMLPVLFWIPFDPLIISYIFGCTVLLVFGVWDDSCELGHYVKFIGQFVAVIPAVYFADLYVATLPLIGDIPESVGKVFTVIAIVGMVNATNHSDGLDGLAGGLSMLSLACIGYLMYLVDDITMVLLVASIMGGIFGFLRFNSHPARVFMGDGGSQFLGFSLGFLVIVLTQKSNPALSPALPLLILGLPVVDIIAVFYLRISGGMNWFKATRNHIHHRLLDLGFTHYESVIIIYFVQMLLVLSSIFLMYEYDALILFIYFTVVILVFSGLTLSERAGFKLNRKAGSSIVDGFINEKLRSKMVLQLLGSFVVAAVSYLFLSVGFAIKSVPADIGYLSLGLVVLSLIVFVVLNNHIRNLAKLVLYVTAAFVVYLDFNFINVHDSLFLEIEVVVYVLMALALVMVIKFDNSVDFNMSPLDYLMAIIVLIAFIAFSFSSEPNAYGDYILKMILLFYGCELIEKRNVIGFKIATVAALSTLMILAFRTLAL